MNVIRYSTYSLHERIEKKIMKQMTFKDISDGFTLDKVEDKVLYNKVHVNNATFKAGLAAKVHRWFRLTPSFGPDLVRKMHCDLECKKSDVVLDPFAGAGTTLIESQLKGITSYGFEINPLLHFVGETSLNWDLDTQLLYASLNTLNKYFSLMDKDVSFDNLAEKVLEIPPIHNPTRWWRKDVLAKLCILRHCVDRYLDCPKIHSFFRLTLAGVLVPDLTNVTLGRLQLHFIDRSEDDIDVWAAFEKHAKKMICDVDELKAIGYKKNSTLFLTDSTKLENIEIEKKVRCVITSPPYPNRYSYVWNTRPHLYMLGFIKQANEASALDKLTIGGTWGTATSVLSKGVIRAVYPIIEKAVEPTVNEIRASDNLMANYVMKYFNLLATQIKEMDKFLSNDARIAYVVGCSRIKKVFVETDLLLAKIIEGLGLGYEIREIERIRRRNSGKDLHESIVYAWKKN